MTPQDMEALPVGDTIVHPRLGEARIIGVYDTDPKTGDPLRWEVQSARRGVILVGRWDLTEWRPRR